MRSLWILAMGFCLAVVPATGNAQFFFDNFDSYAAGSSIDGQGDWETWDQNPAGDTTVSNAQSFSPSNSLLVAGAADVVKTFSPGLNSGTWYVKAQTYVPSDQEGDMYFIINDIYNPGGPYHWAVQIVLCVDACNNAAAVPGQIVNIGGTDVAGIGTAPLVVDDWAEIIVEVDLDAGEYTVFYDGALLDGPLTWQTSGTNEIANLDLFSDGSTESYMDDIYVDQTVPVELQAFTAE